MGGGRIVYRDEEWIHEGGPPAGSGEEPADADPTIQG
jgi:hypothetical protein